MQIRRQILFTAVAAACCASPALAGDYPLPQLAEADAGASYAYGEAETGAPVAAGYPAYAHPAYGPMVPQPMPQGVPQGMPMGPGMQPMALPAQPGAPRVAYSDAERADWLKECRKRYGDSDNGLGGALIGGVIGGIAGNQIAGKGNRAVGTIAGAAVGAVAGAAIDKAEDSGRARDACEDYLARYEAGYGAGYPAYGYGYGAGYGGGYAYGQNVIWVPMIVGWDCKPKEQVIEEWVEEKPAARVIPKKIVPVKTKTVPIKQTKYTTKYTKGS